MKKRKLTMISLFILMIFYFDSCSKKPEQKKEISNTETTGDNDIENFPDVFLRNDNANENVKDNTNDSIKDNNLQIRSNPDTDSEILGSLNISDYISIIDIIEQEDTVKNSKIFWYKITTSENIIGWISSEDLEPITFERPNEFTGKTWNNNFGSLYPVENVTTDDLQSCSWERYNTILHFSQESHYAKMDHSARDKYGRYTLKDNTIYFFPPIKIVRFASEFTIGKLHYSNEIHYEGSPVLRSDDETVVFLANGSQKTNIGDIVKMYQYYCEKIWERGKLNSNGFLYSLPDTSSINMFQDNYYGRKAMEAVAVKLAKTTINDIVWYYTLVDFTGDEPTDGGGPFYEGWLPAEYFNDTT